MKKFINFLIFTLFLIIKLPLFAIITPPNISKKIDDIDQSTRIETEYKLPAPRNISAFFDDCCEPVIKVRDPKALSKKENIPITQNFVRALQAENPNPILVSKTLLLNALERQFIVNDFITLSPEELTEKYNSKDPFKDEKTRLEFKEFVTTEHNLKEAFNTFKKQPNSENYSNYLEKNTIAQPLYIKYFEGAIADNFLFFDNALNLNKWTIGEPENSNGENTTYFLIPKKQDESGNFLNELQETGLNYKNIKGFNEVQADFYVAMQSKNPTRYIYDSIYSNSEIYKNIALQVDDLINILKPLSNNCASGKVTLNGHGNLDRLNPDGSTNMEASYARIPIDAAKKLISACEHSKISIINTETCYGGGNNFDRIFSKSYPFTVIDAHSTDTPYSYTEHSFFGNQLRIIDKINTFFKEKNKYPNQKELNQIMLDLNILDNKYNDWFQNIDSNLHKALTSFFPIDNVEDNLLTILLATTDYKQNAVYLRDNILQISNVKNSVKSAEGKNFEYNLKTQGDLLLSSDTILAKIIIKQDAELPSIIPLSVGETIFYIKEMIIENTNISISILMDSLLRQITSGNEKITTLPEKTIVIDSLTINGEIVTLVATKDYVLYTINGDISDNEKPYKNYLSLSPREVELKALADFDTLIEKGRTQKLRFELGGIEGKSVAKTISDRQATLRLIQKLVEEQNWDEYKNTQDLSALHERIYENILKAIKQNENKPLNNDFYSKLSAHELEIIANAVEDNFILNELAQHQTDISLINAVTKTFNDLKENSQRKGLIANLQEKSKTYTPTQLIDWYTSLPVNQQKIFNYDFNTLIKLKNFTQDPDTLSLAQRALLINLIQETLLLSTNPLQIADLKKQLDALQSPRDEAKFKEFIKNKINDFKTNLTKNSASDTIFFEWKNSLTSEEKDYISQSLQEVYNEKLYKMIVLDTNSLNKHSLYDIFALNLSTQNNFFLSDTDLIALAKAAGDTADLPIINDKLKSTFQLTNQNIYERFRSESGWEGKTTSNDFIKCLNSDNSYTELFKQAPFALQKNIFDSCFSIITLRKNPDIQQEFTIYQESLLPERISKLQTEDDITLLENDMQDANLTLPNRFKSSFDIKVKKIMTETNQRIEKGLPSLPPINKSLDFTHEPEILNNQTDQTIHVNPHNDPIFPNPVNPTDPTFNPTGNHEYDEKAEQDRLNEEKRIAAEIAAADKLIKDNQDAARKAQEEAQTQGENYIPHEIKLPSEG